MTLTTSHNWIAYTAAGGTVFAYDFLVVAASDLKVYDNRVLVTSGYTVSGVGVGSGGNVTFTTAPTNGHVLLLIRETDDTQQVNLMEGDKLPAEPVEGVFDKVYAALQDVREQGDRAFGLPVSRAGDTPVMPDFEDSGIWGKALKVNAAGDGLDVFTLNPSDIASPLVSLGDLIQGGVGGAPERLAIGTVGQVATVAAGKVSWADPPNVQTLFDAKGDLLVGTADDTAVRKAVGADLTILSPASGEADGLKYRAASEFPGANAWKFTGIATPSTPATGDGLLYTAAGTPLKQPAWLDAGGQIHTLSGVIYREVGNPSMNVASTAAETSLFAAAPTIKANTLTAGRVLRITLLGDLLNNTGAGRDIVFRFKYGTVTFATLGATAAMGSSATRYGLRLTAELTTLAPGVQYGSALRYLPNTVGVSATSLQVTNNNFMSVHNGIAVDETADRALDVTAQPEVSSASLSARAMLILVELL